MALIVLLILSQDENFNKSVHEVVSVRVNISILALHLGSPFFTERDYKVSTFSVKENKDITDQKQENRFLFAG
jgi:hypothetical protein